MLVDHVRFGLWIGVVGVFGCEKGFKITYEIKLQRMFLVVVFKFEFTVI